MKNQEKISFSLRAEMAAPFPLSAEMAVCSPVSHTSQPKIKKTKKSKNKQ